MSLYATKTSGIVQRIVVLGIWLIVAHIAEFTMAQAGAIIIAICAFSDERRSR